MSYVPIGASIAAAKAREEQQKEEERMTQYNSNDLEGWEFKIVRSAFGRFSNRESIERLCQEEAKAGWEMVEKFDSYRIRFKRRTEHRKRDQHLSFDPYRTSLGTGDATKIFVAVGILVAVLGIAILLFNFGN